MKRVIGNNIMTTTGKRKERQKSYQIATLNCRTLTNEIKLLDTALEAKRLGLDILAVQEHKLKGDGDIDLGKSHTELKNWRFLYSGFDTAYGGAGFFLNPKSIKIIDDTILSKGRIYTIRLKLGYMKVIVTNIYAPTETQAETTKKDFLSETGKGNF